MGAALSLGTATSDDARSAATFALYAVMALVAGAAVLAPAVVGPVVRMLRVPVRRRGGAIGMLIRAGALTATRRTASIAAPVLLTVAFAVLVSGMVRTTTAAYAAGRAGDVNAGWIVVPDRTPGLSDQAVTATGGTALLPTTVFVSDPSTPPENRPLTALGVDPAGFAAANRALTVVAGSLGDLSGDDTVVLTATANRQPTDPFALIFADGELVSLRVVAVVTDDSIPGDLLLPRSVVRKHDPSALSSAVYVRERIDPPPGARILDVAAWAAEADRAEDRLVWLATLLLIAVSAGYGAVAVANTLLMAAAGRVPDLRLIRLAGATRRQVIWLVTAESALVVLIGALLGGAVAFVGLLSIRAGLAEQAGVPVDLVVPWSVVGGVVGLCLLLAALASALPTWRSLRHPAARPPSTSWGESVPSRTIGSSDEDERGRRCVWEGSAGRRHELSEADQRTGKRLAERIRPKLEALREAGDFAPGSTRRALLDLASRRTPSRSPARLSNSAAWSRSRIDDDEPPYVALVTASARRCGPS